MITVSFKGAYRAIPSILDRLAIPYRNLGDQGFEVDFPDTVKISSNQDEYSQPSVWLYQVGECDTFIYPLATGELTWHGVANPAMVQFLDMLR